LVRNSRNLEGRRVLKHLIKVEYGMDKGEKEKRRLFVFLVSILSWTGNKWFRFNQICNIIHKYVYGAILAWV
jgi:hypothetical protein